MEEIKVSVIVPAYNVEKYIGECLESICNQTYKNIEIIVVDDGSTDNTGIICDEFADKDARMKVFHNENMGVVSARNCGINNSKGDYISFVDADDWIDSELVFSLVSSLPDKSIDMIASGHYLYEKRKLFDGLDAGLYELPNDREFILENYFPKDGTNHNIVFSQFAKLYKRDLLNKITMNIPSDIAYGEDTLLNFIFLNECKKILVTKICHYHYRYNPKSVTIAPDNSYIHKISRQYLLLREVIDEYNVTKTVLEGLHSYYFRRLIEGLNTKIELANSYHIPTFKSIKIFGCGEEIILYGAGKVGKDLLFQIRNYTNVKVSAWVDKNYNDIPDFWGQKAVGIDEIKKIPSIPVIVAVSKEELYSDIYTELTNKHGIKADRIIWAEPTKISYRVDI